MSITLNTGDAAYAKLRALIGVDSSGAIVDAKGLQTLTPNAAVIIGSGTYGRHFRTSIVSTNALGVAMSPGISTKPVATKSMTFFLVFNNIASRSGRGAVFNAEASVTPSLSSGGLGAASTTASGTPTVSGTTNLLAAGAHSLAVTINGDTSGTTKILVDGVLESSGGQTGNSTDNTAAFANYIGGAITGGFGGCAGDYVWLAVYDVLTDAEVLRLHNSLGANNTFAAVSAPPAVNLAISNLASNATLSTAAVTVTPPVAGVVNLAVSNLATAGTLSTAAVTVTPVQGTITSDVFTAYGSPAPLAALTVPHVTVTRMTDRVQVLSLASQVTNGAGRLVLVNAAIVAGVWYMLASWNADGTLRGFKAHLAA